MPGAAAGFVGGERIVFRVETSPHKYEAGALYLRIVGHDQGVLLFETDAAGKVTWWRVGVPPQIDYVEGCS